MKKLSWLFAAILPVLLLVASCEKQIASDVSATGGRTPTVRTAQPLTWTVSPSPAVAGQPVTICAPIPCGKAKVLMSTDGGAYAAVTGFLQAGQVCFTFTPDAADCDAPTPKYRFALQFAPGGGDVDINCQGGGFNANSYDASGLFCLGTEQACTDEDALTITGNAQILSSVDGWSTVKVTYCVTACKAITGVKTQGGATAGGNVGATVPTDVTAGATVNALNNNYVLSWTNDFAAGQTRCYSFTYTRAFTACGSVTGAWSAKSTLSEASILPLQACP